MHQTSSVNTRICVLNEGFTIRNDPTVGSLLGVIRTRRNARRSRDIAASGSPTDHGSKASECFALLAIGAVLLGACTQRSEPSTTTAVEVDPVVTTTTQPVTGDYFDLIRQLQSDVRSSPDHLEYEIARVAREGDLDEILAFVRDHFTVIPPHEGVWVSPATTQWWGWEGALRSGSGTPREIADVLAHAVGLAGYEATIVRRLDPASRPDLLEFRSLPAFDPELFSASGDTLDAAKPVAAEVADRLGAKALESLSEPFELTVFSSDVPRGMPTVVVERDGGRVMAGLWTEDPGWEPVDFAPEVGEATSTPEVGVRVLVAMTDDPNNPVEIASASIPAEDLVGRPMIVSFVPAVASAADLLALAPADVNAVVPTIRLGGFDEEPEMLTDAPALTLDGRVLTLDGDGWSSGTNAFGGSGDPSAVSSLEIRRISAGRYPWVEVDLEVSGIDGPVADLAADAFTLDEDDQPRPVLLERASAPRPRVIFLLDVSLSIPEQYRGEGAADVVAAMAERLLAERPDAEFQIALAGIQGASGLGWTQDIEKLRRDAALFAITGGLWAAYADVSTLGGNVVVFLTDGRSVTPTNDPQPEPPPDVVPQLLAAPPAIMLGAGDFGEAYYGLAELTGGVTLDVEDEDRAVAEVLEQIDSLLTGYSIRYRSVEEGPEIRAVEVSVAGISAASTYEVPGFEAPAVGPAGLYLELTTGAVPHVRTLAGVPFRSRRAATLADTEDVRRALFGTYSIHAEPGMPTASVLVDDALSAVLQWEPVLDSGGADQVEALTRLTPVSPLATTFAVPYSDPKSESRTFELGMRFWIETERPALKEDRELLVRSVDIVPLSRVVTLAGSSEAVFSETVTRTGRLSSLEDHLFDLSPVDRLLDADLVLLTDVESDRRTEFNSVIGGWPGSTTFLVPVDGPADAAIGIRPDGTTIAIGSGGRGVGITEEEAEARFDQVQNLLDMAGSLGGGPGAWAKLEKAKMDKLRFATIAIIRMDAEGVAELIEEEACDAISSAGDRIIDAGVRSAGLGGFADSLSEAVERINEFGGAAGFGELPTGLDAC